MVLVLEVVLLLEEELVLVDVHAVRLLDNLEDHLLLNLVLLPLDGAGAALGRWLGFLFHFRPTAHTLRHFSSVWLPARYLALEETIAKATRLH